MMRVAPLLAGVAIGVATLGGPDASAQGAQPQSQRPQYLPFAEFASDDNAGQVSIKQAYNDAVERYNRALYDYHVTLGQHDQLVEQHSRAGTPAEAEKARAEAASLRAKLQTLRRDVMTLAGTVDQARRRASQAGVTLIR